MLLGLGFESETADGMGELSRRCFVIGVTASYRGGHVTGIIVFIEVVVKRNVAQMSEERSVVSGHVERTSSP